MVRKIAVFYLVAMALAFVISVYIGLKGLHPETVFLYALLAWPTSALILVAQNRLGRILAHHRQDA